MLSSFKRTIKLPFTTSGFVCRSINDLGRKKRPFFLPSSTSNRLFDRIVLSCRDSMYGNSFVNLHRIKLLHFIFDNYFSPWCSFIFVFKDFFDFCIQKLSSTFVFDMNTNQILCRILIWYKSVTFRIQKWIQVKRWIQKCLSIYISINNVISEVLPYKVGFRGFGF